MPYYGPRRQPGVPARMVSIDPHETVRGMTQAVLDIRVAAAWLRAQPEIDAEQLGIMGISLGGITGAGGHGRAAFQQGLLVAGRRRHGPGGLGSQGIVSKLRKQWIAGGGTKETLAELMKRSTR